MRPVPAAATWLLERFSSSAEHESVLGDLFEQYHFGRGRLWYCWQVFGIVVLRLYRTATRPSPVSKRSPGIKTGNTALALLVSTYVAIFAFEPRVPDIIAFFLLVPVPLGTLGTVFVLYWYKRHPLKVQALGLIGKKARSLPVQP